MLKNIEAKVYAALVGSGAGGAVSVFVLWLIGLAFGGSGDQAAAAVPAPVTGVVLALLPALGAAIGGYSAEHTERPDLPGPEVRMPYESSN